MNRFQFYQKSWKYYLILERHFFAIEKYITFAEENFMTYSDEFAKQLLTICSEIDVQCKIACNINGNTKAGTIAKYAEILLPVWNNFTSTKVTLMSDSEFCLMPWMEWSAENSPTWWKAYNTIKHRRLEDRNIGQANLKNVMNALAALYILETYLYKDIIERENPKLDQFLRPQNSNKYFQFWGWQKDIYGQ